MSVGLNVQEKAFKQFTFHHQLPFSKVDVLQVLTYTAVLPLKCAVLGLCSNLILCN